MMTCVLSRMPFFQYLLLADGSRSRSAEFRYVQPQAHLRGRTAQGRFTVPVLKLQESSR